MKLLSDAFAQMQLVPRRYTCDGENLSPPLRWEGLPEGTRSLALIVEDPDAPGGLFTHWLLYNLPADRAGLAEGVVSTSEIPAGGLQGRNSFGQIGYGGPCPPHGTHRYVFRLYALDAPLELKPGATREQLLGALQKRMLASDELVGRYSRVRVLSR